ncbi:1,6-dihydroxycyclohexa-2,4-diene-1-carboxylate dehydrogenase [Pararobbsia alpina]|uniref:1,6-dihydroxycyclohexa-2,4-diene-1-carboxylate dehydrogenase n=1 Tax=Pararobbsia alpina TaxID=621374 RepID=UPI0039A52B9B
MRRPGRFDDQVVIVTGAAQGIGEGVARAIGAEGGIVVAVDRSPIVHEIADAIQKGKGNARSMTADLEHYDGAAQVTEFALDTFGRVDILINNVGGTIWAKPYEHYEIDQIEAEIRRSLFPTLWCCRAVLPSMIERRSGVIVNVSSVATRGVHRVPYSAAKGGVNALTASLAFEHAKHGIRVNAVAPGGTEAPPRRVARGDAPASEQERTWYQGVVDQTVESSLMHRYGTIAEQVEPILFLASSAASYVTGTVVPVAGGDLG